jgi:hypothetical protein
MGVRTSSRRSTHCRPVAAKLNAAHTETYPAARKYERSHPASRIIGAADGSIMPVIITTHIVQRSTRCGTSHTGVIIQAPAPVIGPYMSRAIAMIHAQETSGTRTSRAITDQVRAASRMSKL